MLLRKIHLIFYSCLILSSIIQNTAQCSNSNFDMRRLQIEGTITSVMINLGIMVFGKKILDTLPEASTQTAEFVQSIGDEYDIPHDYNIKLGTGDAAGDKTIIVQQGPENFWSTQSGIDKALNDLDNATTEEQKEAALAQLDEHIGILDHEFCHYKHHDARNALLVSSAFSIGSIVAYLSLEKYFYSAHLSKLTDQQKRMYGMGSGSIIGLLNISFSLWYRIQLEKRADEHVRKDPHVLKAMALWAQRLQKELKERLNNSNWLGKKFATGLEKYPSLYYLLDPVHPPLPHREARFKERLAALEQNSENAVVVNS